ncbi:MAG: ComEC/Rec2 family competence protein [Proteobacteria bacterium]|nr:ComEC/Rec2 family competence protein [Pseudomonadota bacterium]
MLKRLHQVLTSCYFAEHHRWVHWLPVGLIFGIASYFSLAQEPSTLIYLLLIVITAASIIWTRKNSHSIFFAYLSIGFCIGFTLIGVKVNNNSTLMFNAPQKTAKISGMIESIENHPYKKDETLRIILNQVKIGKDIYNAKIRLNTPEQQAQTWDIGDKLQIEASIYPIPMPNSLHGYFARRAAFLQEVGGTARLQKIISHKNTPDHNPLTKYRHRLTQKLLSNLQEPYGAIAAALVTGDRSYIPTELRQSFADAGLAHVLAISGLHLSLIAGLIFLLLRRLMCLCPPIANRFPIKKLAALLAAIASGFYMAIADFGIPVQRSFVMISLAMFAICLDRTAFSMRSLAIAATVVLVIAPQSLLSASFQLSFAAVLGLLAFYESAWPKLQETLIKNSSSFLGFKKIAWGLFGILITTTIASLATTPYSVAFFQRFTAQAILGNLIAIPLVSFLIMPLGLFNVFFLLFGGSSTLFWLWEKSLAMLCATAELVAKLPGAAIQVKAVPEYALATFSLGMLWLCLWKKSWRWLGLAPIFLGIFLWRIHELPIAYVSSQCDIMAYTEQNTAYISDQERNNFTSDIWTQEWGVDQQKSWKNSYVHFTTPNLLLITSPKDGIEYLQQTNNLPKSIITFGYANTLKKYGITANQVIDRNIIQYTGGIAVFKKAPHFCFLKDYFGKRPWCCDF